MSDRQDLIAKLSERGALGRAVASTLRNRARYGEAQTAEEDAEVFEGAAMILRALEAQSKDKEKGEAC